MSQKTIEQVIREYSSELMCITEVVAVGQGISNNKPVIRILVIEKTPEVEQKIPDLIEGYRVLIVETGEFHSYTE